METDTLLTREEILTGLPARSAQTLLFLVESRTARLLAQSRQATERFLTEEAAHERGLAYLEAFSLGRQPPRRPTIQDIEFAVVAAGQPAQATVRLGYPSGEQELQASTGDVPDFLSLHHVAFQLPDTPARELKVWVHRVTGEDESESLPGRLDVRVGEETRQFDLALAGGPVVLPLTGAAREVNITLSGSEGVV